MGDLRQVQIDGKGRRICPVHWLNVKTVRDLTGCVGVKLFDFCSGNVGS